MIQEQSGIDIGGKVHLEDKPVLLHSRDYRGTLCLLMLGAVHPLCPEGVDNICGIQVEHACTDVQTVLADLIGHWHLAIVGYLGVAAVKVNGHRIA